MEHSEFERIKAAKRGTLRYERGEGYVIIVHCSSYQTIEGCLIDHTSYHASIYNNARLTDHREFDSTLTDEQLHEWITAQTGEERR